MALRGSSKLEHRLEQMLMMLMVTMRKEEVPSFFFVRHRFCGFYADVCHR